MKFREVKKEDREFILKANREINELSGLNDSTLEKRIDKDLFEDKSCKLIIAEIDNNIAGFILYSYIYWANCGKGIYLSQAYVNENYRGQGVYKELLSELEKRETKCNFITDLVGPDNEVMKNVLHKLKFESCDLITYYRMINK